MDYTTKLSNGKTLIENMITYAFRADKSVKIEDAVFAPETNLQNSGDMVRTRIDVANNITREKMGVRFQFSFFGRQI